MTRARRFAPLLAAAVVTAGALALAGAAGAQRAPAVSIAPGALTKVTGQPVTLTARARTLPPGASIVILGIRADGRVVTVRACPRGVRVCVGRISSRTAQTVRFRAVVRLRGRVLRSSGVVRVTWRPPVVTPPPPPPPPPPALYPRLNRVLQDGGINAYCTSPLPAGAGAGTATMTAPYGSFTSQWTLPAEIVPGATAMISIMIQPAAGQRLAAGIVIKPTSEFGAAPPPFEVSGFADIGQTFSGSRNFTFTPTRAFTAGEVLYIRLENSCTAFNYEYVVR